MAPPRTQLAWAQSLYDARSLAYDNSWHPAFAAHMAAVLAPPRGTHILDLACGTGLATYALAARVAPTGSVLGVDASAGMLAQADRKSAAFSAQLRREHGPALREDVVCFAAGDVCALADVDALCGWEARFDGAVCASALVLLREPGRAVADWLRYVRRGGRLVVDVPHQHNQRHLALMEMAARRAGVEVAFFRAWVTGEEAVRGMFERLVDADGRRLAEVERIEFVSQVGYGVRRYTTGREDAEEMFEGALGPLQLDDEHVKARLRDAYLHEWMAAFEEGGGVVEDVDGVYVATVRRL